MKKLRYTIDKNGTETEPRECLFWASFESKDDQFSLYESLHKMYDNICRSIFEASLAEGATVTVAIFPDTCNVKFCELVKSWLDLFEQQEKIINFFQDIYKEMKKVTWPKKNELKDSTVIVVVTMVIFAVFVYLVDKGISEFLKVIF